MKNDGQIVMENPYADDPGIYPYHFHGSELLLTGDELAANETGFWYEHQADNALPQDDRDAVPLAHRAK
jgi:hypothetical protein